MGRGRLGADNREGGNEDRKMGREATAGEIGKGRGEGATGRGDWEGEKGQEEGGFHRWI